MLKLITPSDENFKTDEPVSDNENLWHPSHATTDGDIRPIYNCLQLIRIQECKTCQGLSATRPKMKCGACIKGQLITYPTPDKEIVEALQVGKPEPITNMALAQSYHEAHDKWKTAQTTIEEWETGLDEIKPKNASAEELRKFIRETPREVLIELLEETEREHGNEGGITVREYLAAEKQLRKETIELLRELYPSNPLSGYGIVNADEAYHKGMEIGIWGALQQLQPTSPNKASQPTDNAGVTAEDYEEVMSDHKRLVRELDEIMNGKDGMAQQASLCDLVVQAKDIFTQHTATQMPSVVKALQDMIDHTTKEFAKKWGFAPQREQAIKVLDQINKGQTT